MSTPVTVELRPPTWWRSGRAFFVAFGVVSLALGGLMVSAVLWLAVKGSDLDVPLLVLALVLLLEGATLVVSTRRTARYRAMALVLETDHAIFPRLATNESVRVAYDEIGPIRFMKRPSLRLRIFVHTKRGDFFVHRSWLPAGWTLEKLTAEIVQRRDAARAPGATSATP